MHDFDFLFAQPWAVANTRLAPDGTWERFPARCVVDPLAGGGHVDKLSFPDLPGSGAVEAFTIRLFEPATSRWRIWWSSSTRPGHLDAPMLGGFEDGVGTFLGQDLDPDVQLRFRWITPPAAPRWEQARSRDGGATWTTDWTMELTPA